MLSRLRYAVLLLLALLAIFLGLWPSLLTFGALLALPLAVIAVAGLLRPAAVEQRRALRRFAAVGGGVLVAELVVVLAVVAWTPRRPVLLVVQSPAPTRVRVVYGVADGAPRSWLRWSRRYQVPASGVVHSRYSADREWYQPENPRPVRAVAETRADPVDTIPVIWARGGTTQVGSCTFAYDEFVLGNAAYRTEQSEEVLQRTGWLDSLSTWGVECRDGKLY